MAKEKPGERVVLADRERARWQRDVDRAFAMLDPAAQASVLPTLLTPPSSKSR